MSASNSAVSQRNWPAIQERIVKSGWAASQAHGGTFGLLVPAGPLVGKHDVPDADIRRAGVKFLKDGDGLFGSAGKAVGVCRGTADSTAEGSVGSASSPAPSRPSPPVHGRSPACDDCHVGGAGREFGCWPTPPVALSAF
jgi:hypothetical protein